MNNLFNFLYYISKDTSSDYWKDTLTQTLSPLGNIKIAHNVSSLRKIKKGNTDMIIIDTEDVYDVQEIIKELRRQSPSMKIVIASDVCTWRRARKAFKLGASDYIQKSKDVRDLRAQFISILSESLPNK